MLPVYLLCAAAGIPLVAVFALGGGDADVDAGLDVDAGADIDIGDAGIGDLTALYRRVPLSSWAMLVAFFGGVGTVSTWLGVSGGVTLFLAVSLGIVAAVVNTALFSLVRSGAASSELHDADIIGRLAVVSIPIEGDHRGRIALDTGEERIQMTACISRTESERRLGVGDDVIVVAVDNGVAEVVSASKNLELDR